MLDFSNKKFVLMGTLLVLLTLFLFIPVVYGLYAITPGAASTIGPGTYQDTHLTGHINGYYNVSCEVGDIITVHLVYNNSVDSFALYLLDPTGTVVVADENPPYGDDTVSAIINVTGIYTIQINRIPSLVDINITITITITQGNGLPGGILVLIIIFPLIGVGLAAFIIYKRREVISD